MGHDVQEWEGGFRQEIKTAGVSHQVWRNTPGVPEEQEDHTDQSPPGESEEETLLTLPSATGSQAGEPPLPPTSDCHEHPQTDLSLDWQCGTEGQGPSRRLTTA